MTIRENKAIQSWFEGGWHEMETCSLQFRLTYKHTVTLILEVLTFDLGAVGHGNISVDTGSLTYSIVLP